MTAIPKPISKTKDAVTLSRKDWDRVITALEDASDRKSVDAFRARREARGISAAAMKRILAGESPVRVYRDVRGMTAAALAKSAGIPASYLSAIETGGKPGSAAALKRIAAELSVDMEDIVG